jgi:hypothetical protein
VNSRGLTPFNLVVLAMALMLLCCNASTPEEVADRVDEAVAELKAKTWVRNPQEVPPVASKFLTGYTDAELIRGIAAWMSRDKSRYRVNVPTYAGNLLRNDPNLIKDFSELRKLIATEEDPEQFFLLCLFTGYVPDRGTYIPEMSRMLFRHGRVSPPNSNTTSARFLGDVGAFTYHEIVVKLKNQNAAFDESTMLPNGGDGSYAEKIKTLAKWLRENWPGCENLGDGEELMLGSGIEAKTPHTPAERPAKRFPTTVDTDVAVKPTASKPWWLVVTIGIIALATLIVWLNRRSKGPGIGSK